jgi:hypothetical protein
MVRHGFHSFYRLSSDLAQHVRMGEQGQGSGGAVFSQGQVDCGPVQRLSLLAHKERLAGWLHACPFSEPCADGPQLVAAQRLRRR